LSSRGAKQALMAENPLSLEAERTEEQILAGLFERAAALRPICDNRTDLIETVAKDVPAALARLFQMLEEFAATPGRVPQSEADQWAHEASVLIIQLKNAKSESLMEQGMPYETRLALARASMPERERQLAKRLRRTAANEDD
jgi:hypothetical protein